MDSLDPKQIAEIKGRKIGFLLAASTLSEEVKDELFALAEKMTPDQLDRLSEVLEAKFLDEETNKIDEEYKAKLNNLVEKYSTEDKKIEEEVSREVKAIESLSENN